MWEPQPFAACSDSIPLWLPQVKVCGSDRNHRERVPHRKGLLHPRHWTGWGTLGWRAWQERGCLDCFRIDIWICWKIVRLWKQSPSSFYLRKLQRPRRSSVISSSVCRPLWPTLRAWASWRSLRWLRRPARTAETREWCAVLRYVQQGAG